MKSNLKKKRLVSFEDKQRLSGYIFTAPFIIGIVLLFLPNIFRTVYFSLNNISVTANGFSLDWAGIKYYRQALLSDVNFNTYAVDSLRKMIMDLPVILIFSLFIASILKQSFKGRTIVRSIFFLPIILATGVVNTVLTDSTATELMTTGVTEDLMVSNELSNFAVFLKSLNIGGVLMEIIVSSANSLTSIINSSGIQILIFLTAFQEVPESLYEAASVEGCTAWESFWKITIPVVSPQIAVNAIYTVADSFVDNKVFEYTSKLAFEGNQFSLATAMSIIYLLALGVSMLIIGWLMIKMVKASR